MNYLAHTLLSGKDEHIIIGNFLADIIRKNELNTIDIKYNNGFILHRAIDAYTDSHDSIKLVTKVLRTNHKKYAPVVTDILLDYILGQSWHVYCNEPIQNFADIRYEIIRNHIGHFPERIRPIVAKMIDGNFLIKYTTIEGLMFTFEKIQEVARFPSDFTQAIEDLEENYDLLNKQFNTFFPQLIAHIKEMQF
jgi:acyl carrier protein phosphodiesterase